MPLIIKSKTVEAEWENVFRIEAADKDVVSTLSKSHAVQGHLKPSQSDLCSARVDQTPDSLLDLQGYGSLLSKHRSNTALEINPKKLQFQNGEKRMFKMVVDQYELDLCTGVHTSIIRG